MQYAPICLFTYNRLWHTQKTLASLLKDPLAKYSTLFIFSDGPKNEQSKSQVQVLRDYLKTISGFAAIDIIYREHNLGLANSIIQGVTQIVNHYGKVIVLEDDLELSPYFLTFMNEGLDFYQDNEKVASIHGYAFPIKETMPETYFLKGADCWGWATWKRAWDKFEPDGKKLLKLLTEKNMAKAFDFNFTQPNIQMLKDQINGKNNSWAIRWNASAFINNLLTLYPGKSLVRNIGLDNTGEHCAITDIFDVTLSDEKITINTIRVEHSEIAYQHYVNFFKKYQIPLYKRIVRKMINGIFLKRPTKKAEFST